MTHNFRLLFIGLVCLCFSSSCISYKGIRYFQDIDSAQLHIAMPNYKPPVIQKNDIVGVYINTSETGTETMFGTSSSESATAGQSGGFLVDELGEIKLPTIGKLKLDGLTTNAAAKLISDKVKMFIKTPNVAISVRILNFKVSIGGEVSSPGVFTVANEKINVLEALTLAGDLKLTAKRENILVIRQDSDKFQFARLDLRSKSTLTSPYFYLKNNDYVYVEPNVQRLERNDNTYRNISLVLSVLTVISLVVFRLR